MSKLMQYIIKYIILIIGWAIKIRYRKFIRNNCKGLNPEELGKTMLGVYLRKDEGKKK